MPSTSNQDDMLLLIRCPTCGQRFKVGEDLRGRTVECGGCEHRFKINDEVIVRGKKFYPGERNEPTLNRFQRVPMALAAAPIEGVRYDRPPDPSTFEPASPQRILAGLVGGTGMVLMALLLILGASRGGMLDGMSTDKRMMMAGFTGLLGIILLAYANPKARKKAVGIGSLMAAVLVALPLFFTFGSVVTPVVPQVDFSAFKPGIADEPAVETSDDKLQNLIGTKPLEDQILSLKEKASPKNAIGLWLKNLRQQNRILVRDYIQRVTGVEESPHFHPREDGNFLLVIPGTDSSLDEVAKFAIALGTVENIHPKLSVIEVNINNENFVSGSIEKLTDKTDAAFYDLNKKELDSIDLDRVSSAVERLTQAEPKVYRSDISRKLIALLGTQWVTFKGEICSALAVWSEKPGPAGDAALVQVSALFAKESDIPKEMIALVVKEKNPGILPILDQLWQKKPTEWESLYGDFGQAAEASLIRTFPSTEAGLRQSAVRLLGRVGSKDSLPVLEGALERADSEMKVLIEKASASIRSRVGG